MGLDLYRIHEAIADQIRLGVERDINVSPWNHSGMELDLIEVWAGGDDAYVGYIESFGENGLATVQVTLNIYVSAGDAETVFRKMTDLLSVGTGNGSSVADAIMDDRTLGGVVADCVALRAEWSPTDPDLGTFARIPLNIILNKTGAKV